MAQRSRQRTVVETQKKATRWRCTVCGYEHTGSDAPNRCPRCGAPKKRFVKVRAENL